MIMIGLLFDCVKTTPTRPEHHIGNEESGTSTIVTPRNASNAKRNALYPLLVLIHPRSLYT
jgi:hypothetical protein